MAVDLLVGAFLSYRFQKCKLDGHTSTTGTVVALERDVVDPWKTGVYCHAVEFPATGGKIIRLELDFGTFPASYHVSQAVTVRNDPSRPQDAEIESGNTRWLVPGM